MDEKYDTRRISENEKRMERAEELLDDMDALLEKIRNEAPEWAKLCDWYVSEDMQEDLKADEEGRVPKDLKRGVLSEDGVWNLMMRRRSTILDLLEACTGMLRNE